MLKTISFATLVAFAATSSFAGSLSTATDDDDVTPVYVPTGGSGIGVPAVIGGVAAAAAVAALVSDSNSSDGTTETALED